MSCRELPPAEWAKVEHIFEANGSRLPHPQMAKIFVAERDEKVVGMTVLHWVPNLEVQIERGQGEHYLRSLVRMAEDALRNMGGSRCLCYTSDPHVSQLIEHFGGQKFPATVYQKEVV